MKITPADVDEYPYPDFLRERLMKDCHYSEKGAAYLIREAKRLLYLASLSKEPLAPSTRVDDAWHTMLLFTKFYKNFCDFLGVYIHHDPTPPGYWEEKEAKGEINSLSKGSPDYIRTKSLYKEIFKEEPHPWSWS